MKAETKTEMKPNQKITRDTTIGQIIEKYPETVETLMSFGVHCVGCHVSGFESIEMGFRGHGMSEEDIDEAVKELNKIVAHKPEPEQETIEVKAPKLTITKQAAVKIKQILEQTKKTALRVSVVPGGCSGHRYSMEVTEKSDKEDLVFEEHGAKVFIDKKSLATINGSQVDYVDSLQGAGFKITNPNAKATCGCGESFK